MIWLSCLKFELTIDNDSLPRLKNRSGQILMRQNLSVSSKKSLNFICLWHFVESDEEEHHIDGLPDDLKIAVLEDNKKFAHEIEEWDREQARKAAGAGGGGDADVTVVSESKPGTVSLYI